MKTCSVPGCDERSHSKEMCRNHYRRQRLYGSPTGQRLCPICGETIEPGVTGQVHPACEPTLCMCPAPDPDGLGQCLKCKRLVLAMSWHEGRPMTEQEKAA